MSENKKQHYVPKSYLKQFSHGDEMVYVYNISHKKSFRLNIKDICHENYFYCRPPDIDLEQNLSVIEEVQAKIIAKIIAKSNFASLDPEERLYFYLFVLMQYTRTKKHKDFLDTYLNTIFEANLKPLMKKSEYLIEKGVKPEVVDSLKLKIKVDGPTLMALSPAMMGVESIIDLLPVLLINLTDNNFITSDAPVCFNNYIKSENHGMLGVQSPGLQIFVPLNEKMLLLLIDSESYNLALDEKSIIHVKDPSDIDAINKLQIFNCHENLIHSEKEEEEYLKQLHIGIEEHFQKCNIKSILVSKKRLNDGRYSEIPNTYLTRMDYSLKLSFVKLNHDRNRLLKGQIKRAKKLGEPIKLCRNSEICRIVKERIDKNFKEAKENVRNKENPTNIS